jgi:integrase
VSITRRYDDLAQALDEQLGTFRACVLFAAYVGLRPAEMFVLQWSDFDIARSLIKYQSLAR